MKTRSPESAALGAPSSLLRGWGTDASSHERRLGVGVLSVLFLLALTARAGWGLWRESRSEHSGVLEFPDEVQYWDMTRSLHDGKGLQDELGFRATRMPLYPAFLSLFAGSERGMFAAKTAQWAVGSLVAPFAALLARAYFGRRVSVLAGLWCAVDPFLVFFASLLLTETISITILCAFWWLIARRRIRDAVQAPPASSRRQLVRWLGIGCIAALCVYSRESTIGLVMTAMALSAAPARDRMRNVAGCGIAVAVLTASLVPWGVRNERATGAWCWLTTRTGISLYDGVGPGADGASDLADVKQSPAVRGLGEHAWNRYFLDESFRIVRENPIRIVRLAWVKLGRMWNPFPNVSTHQSRLERWVSVVWMSTTLTLAACGAMLLVVGKARKRNRTDGTSDLPSDGAAGSLKAGQPTKPDPGARSSCDGCGPNLSALGMLLLPAIYFSALHALFVGSVRYRLSAMPMIEVLAAFAAVTIAERILRCNASTRRTCAT